MTVGGGVNSSTQGDGGQHVATAKHRFYRRRAGPARRLLPRGPGGLANPGPLSMSPPGSWILSRQVDAGSAATPRSVGDVEARQGASIGREGELIALGGTEAAARAGLDVEELRITSDQHSRRGIPDAGYRRVHRADRRPLPMDETYSKTSLGARRKKLSSCIFKTISSFFTPPSEISICSLECSKSG